MMRSVVVPVFCLLGALTIHAAGEPGIIKGADEFEFVYRVKLPEITGAARIWIPLAKTDAFQTVTVEELNIPMKWDKVQDRDYGNEICVLNAQPQDSGKTIEVRYRVVRKEKTAYPATNTEAARYLRPEKLVPVNETFKTLAEKAAAGKTDDLSGRKRCTITSSAACDTINQALVGAGATLSTRAMPAPVIVVISTRISLHCREASTYPRVSLSVRPFQPTRTKGKSTATIAGPNFSQTVSGCRSTSAKRGRIRSSPIIILAIIRPIGLN